MPDSPNRLSDWVTRSPSINNQDSIYAFAKEHLVRVSSLMSLPIPTGTDVSLAVKGLDGRYKMVNTAMETLLGKNAEQITGRSDIDFLSSGLAAQIQRTDQQIIDGASAASEELDVPINGLPTRCLWLKFPLLAPDGQMHSIGTLVVDISRKAEIDDLQQSLEQSKKTNQNLQRDLDELDRLASTDKLTGAWNRRRLEEAVISEMNRLKRYDHPLSALIIDIDFFKNINDDHGHVAGDQVLVDLAAVVRSSLRATDSLTRWGGEEFVVLSPNTTLPTMAMLAERLRESITSRAIRFTANW